MEKAKLGIPLTLLGAAVCLLGLYGGYVITGVLVGYILLMEESAWLKKLAVRVVALMLAFSVGSTLINLIPNVLSMVNSLANLFGGYAYIGIVDNLFGVLGQLLSLTKTILFLLLGYNTLSQKEMKLPIVDDLVDKFIQE